MHKEESDNIFVDSFLTLTGQKNESAPWWGRDMARVEKKHSRRKAKQTKAKINLLDFNLPQWCTLNMSALWQQ